jgi:hypothetical protein
MMYHMLGLCMLATAHAANSSDDGGGVSRGMQINLRLRGGSDSCEENKKPTVIVGLGDSFVEFSGQALELFCAGCKYINKGVGGTTTEYWNQAKLAEVAQEALSMGHDVTHIFFNIGANDWMEKYKCSSEAASGPLMNDISAVMANVRSLIPPHIQIVTFGYGQTKGAAREGVTPQSTVDLNAGIRKAAEANGITFISALDLVGSGGATAWTPEEEQTHIDIMHLSYKGYCQVFTSPSVQAFFGCAPSQYDCNSLPNAAAPAPGVGGSAVEAEQARVLQ